MTLSCMVRLLMQITVFHAPKTKELQLQGREGVVKSIVKKYKGKETSANLPYRIQFELEQEGGKQSKFFAHLVSSFINVAVLTQTFLYYLLWISDFGTANCIA